jgi:hypothetical protein
MPLGPTRHHNLAFNRRLAALAARRKQFVEVEVAEEAHVFVEAVFLLQAHHVVVRGMRGEELDVFAALAGADAGDAFGVLVCGFRVEGYAF